MFPSSSGTPNAKENTGFSWHWIHERADANHISFATECCISIIYCSSYNSLLYLPCFQIFLPKSVMQHFTSSSVSKSNINLAGCNTYCNEKLERHSVVISQDTLESKNISNLVEVIRITVGHVRVCCTWCILSEAL